MSLDLGIAAQALLTGVVHGRHDMTMLGASSMVWLVALLVIVSIITMCALARRFDSLGGEVGTDFDGGSRGRIRPTPDAPRGLR